MVEVHTGGVGADRGQVEVPGGGQQFDAWIGECVDGGDSTRLGECHQESIQTLLGPAGYQDAVRRDVDTAPQQVAGDRRAVAAASARRLLMQQAGQVALGCQTAQGLAQLVVLPGRQRLVEGKIGGALADGKPGGLQPGEAAEVPDECAASGFADDEPGRGQIAIDAARCGDRDAVARRQRTMGGQPGSGGERAGPDLLGDPIGDRGMTSNAHAFSRL